MRGNSMQKNNLFVVSFCSVPNKSKPSLATINISNGEVQYIDTGDRGGFTGLCVDKTYVYAIFQYADNSMLPALIIFDKNTNQVVFRERLKEVIDAHSLLVLNNTLFIVSSGTDSVLRYVLTLKPDGCAFGNLTFIEKYWSPVGSLAVTDEHHINSIAVKNNDLCVSSFGFKNGASKKTAQNGAIYNISKNMQLPLDPIAHPHSVLFDGDDIYYCESLHGNVKKNNNTLFNIPNCYIRGLAVTDDCVVVGASAPRKVSKSTGEINDAVDASSQQGCVVRVYCKQTYALIREISFTNEQWEIYDIVAL